MRPHLPITLERFAPVRARVDEGERLPQLFAGQGMSEQVWRSAQLAQYARWLQQRGGGA